MPASDVVLGPVRLPDGVLVLETPRPDDAAAWSAARLANRRWLERAFPAWGDDWEVEQSPLAWVERCRRLRRGASRGLRPFVMRLDGRLVGEIGVDAYDAATHTGEASVWMVRDHGSASVMNAASLLLIDHAFGGERPLDRLLSPVATSAREGRRAGLEAVGFAIEATVPRVVDGEPVDHDHWIVLNTPQRREALRGFLSRYEPAEQPDVLDRDARGTRARTLRAMVREVRAAARAWRSPAPSTPVPRQVDGRAVALSTGSRGVLGALRSFTRHRTGATVAASVLVAGRVVGELTAGLDVGTGTVQVRGSLGADPAVQRAALELVVDAAPHWLDEARFVEVRVPDDAQVADAVLRDEGFRPAHHVEGNPDGPYGTPGETGWLKPL